MTIVCPATGKRPVAPAGPQQFVVFGCRFGIRQAWQRFGPIPAQPVGSSGLEDHLAAEFCGRCKRLAELVKAMVAAIGAAMAPRNVRSDRCSYIATSFSGVAVLYQVNSQKPRMERLRKIASGAEPRSGLPLMAL